MVHSFHLLSYGLVLYIVTTRNTRYTERGTDALTPFSEESVLLSPPKGDGSFADVSDFRSRVSGPSPQHHYSPYLPITQGIKCTLLLGMHAEGKVSPCVRE